MSPFIQTLVVDANPARCEGTLRLLEGAGYSVARAPGGELALQAVAARPPQLLVLDRDLPDLDGLEVCRRLRQDPMSAEVLVVMISEAAAGRDHHAEAIASGADDSLTRPVDERELLARLGALGRVTSRLRRRHVEEVRHVTAAAAAAAAHQTALELRDEALAAKARAEVALAALSQTTELLERTGALAKIGGWQVNLENMKLSWSLETFRIAELEPPVEPPLEDGINLFAPEARPIIQAAIQAAIDDGTPYDLELPIITGKGRHRWVQTQGFAEQRDGKAVRLFGTFQDISERRQAGAALGESEARTRRLLQAASIGLWDWDLVTDEVYYSPECHRQLGFPEGELSGHVEVWIERVHPDDRAGILTAVRDFHRGARATYEVECRMRHKDGGWRWFTARADIERDAAGSPVRMMGSQIDITEQKRIEAAREKLELQLQQAHKLESVGRLAGGVAHDFNNMLGVILGHVELAMAQVDPAQPIQHNLAEIRGAAQRSAAVTRQLLAFARQQAVVPRVIDLNATVTDMLSLLQRLIGEAITIAWQPAETVWTIWMDPSQLDQILTNLCVNARDAIDGVGTITIATSNCSLDDAYCAAHEGAAPGEHVRLTVTDTGSGMDAATLSRIFEPFFTTKGVGAGTGLGLAMIDGAVRQNQGFITVRSELGQGSTFEIFLPRHAGPMPAAEPAPPTGVAACGQETILVVEDEPQVLKLTIRLLTAAGYRVLSAGRPEAALQVARDHAEHIDLLLTDVVMPEMNGHDLAAALRATRPGLTCVFMSGYTADIITRQGVVATGMQFLQKPFERRELIAAVRRALDAAAR